MSGLCSMQGIHMHDIMRCNLCGKLAMILREGGRRTICCDQLMEKLTTRAKEGGKEAHIPVIERTATGIVVSAPGVSDPMGKDHYIEWIEVTEGPYIHLKEVQPGDAQ